MSSVPKPTTLRDPDFLKWIAKQECCANHIHEYHRSPDGFWSDAAHVRTKRNHGDELVVPLCRGAHQEQHRTGIQSFAKKYKLNLVALAEGYRTRYAEGE